MADRTPNPANFFDKLRAEIRRLDQRIDNRAGFDATQLNRTVAKLQALVDGLVNAVNGVFSGFITAGGNITAGGRGTFTGGVTSTDVKTRTLSVGYDSVYIDANNIMGKAPSARRFKQNITPFRHRDEIDQIETDSFYLVGAVEALGDAAPLEYGVIAEQLDEIGLGMYVTRDADGTPHGVAYERLTIPLINAVQDLRAEMREIRAALNV
jgi:hypothetical protein